jgi:hypothetical protein
VKAEKKGSKGEYLVKIDAGSRVELQEAIFGYRSDLGGNTNYKIHSFGFLGRRVPEGKQSITRFILFTTWYKETSFSEH